MKRSALKNLFSFGKKKERLRLRSGDEFKFQTPKLDEPVGGRRFIFALHKSGSVLLNRIVDDLSDAADVPVFNFPELLFENGIRFQDLEEVPADLFEKEGMIYSGFRHVPKEPCEMRFGKGGKVILMVRDPRDILVSMYFSMKGSHAVPKSGKSREKLLKIRENAEALSIEEFVRSGCDRLRKKFRRYQKALVENDDLETRVFRYEDVIFEKPTWVRDISEFFDLNVPEAEMDAIAARHDIRPEKEDPSAHIRRVAPGDYREKLSPETIEFLNAELADTVRVFGYELSGK